MATYTELRTIFNNTSLLNKVTVAVGVAAEIINTNQDTDPPWDQDPSSHGFRVVWASMAYARPQVIAREVLWAIIVKNRSASLDQILEASDSAIQSNTNEVVDLFAQNPSAS